jgi:hypothetical protein
MPSLGRFTLTKIFWSGQNALTCELSSEFNDKIFQMYAGRHLVGVTNSAGDVRLTGQVGATRCPPPITIVMCDLVDRDTDFGSRLPDRPWNEYTIGWDANTFPADSAWFAVYGSAAPGGAVNYSSTLRRTPFAGDGTYSQDLPDLPLCGVWKYGVVATDDALNLGNAGDAAELAITVLLFPPDVLVDEQGRRLTVAIAGGNVTVGFNYDWPDA